MHILIAFIATLSGLIWALWRLQQSGVDLNAFNPFYWKRRRAWAQKVGVKPRHQLDKPMEAAAALLLGAVKTEGEISREQKQSLISLFEKEFRLSSSAARDLFSATAFMLQDVMDMAAEVRPILSPCLEKFTVEQKQSVLDMLHTACTMDGDLNQQQHGIIDATTKVFQVTSEEPNQWA